MKIENENVTQHVRHATSEKSSDGHYHCAENDNGGQTLKRDLGYIDITFPINGYLWSKMPK